MAHVEITPSAKALAIVIDSFLHGSISAEHFQRAFLTAMKTANGLTEREFAIFDQLFAEADAFCADKSLLANLEKERPNWYLDEQALRRAAATARDKLGA